MTAHQRLTSSQPVPVRFSAEEFMTMAQYPPMVDWAGKVELIDGEIVRFSPANVPHWNAQRLAIIDLQMAFAKVGPEWVVGGEARCGSAG